MARVRLHGAHTTDGTHTHTMSCASSLTNKPKIKKKKKLKIVKRDKYRKKTSHSRERAIVATRWCYCCCHHRRHHHRHRFADWLTDWVIVVANLAWIRDAADNRIFYFFYDDFCDCFFLVSRALTSTAHRAAKQKMRRKIDIAISTPLTARSHIHKHRIPRIECEWVQCVRHFPCFGYVFALRIKLS